MSNDPPRRRPLLSNTLRTLSRIYSLFPEENPFSQFADSTHTEAVWQAISAPQKSLLTPITDAVVENSGLRNDGNVEVKDLPVHDGANEDVNAEVLCEENGLNSSEMIIDELNGAKETERVEKADSNEKGTNDHTVEASILSQGLLGIETLLMDESDDMDLLHMSDKDGNFDIIGDFDTFMIGDELGVLVESNGNDKMVGDGSLKEDLVVENKGKDMEVKNSLLGGNAGQSHAHLPKEREITGSSQDGSLLVSSTPQEVGRKEPKVYKRKVRQANSEIGGLIFSTQGSKNEGGTISGAEKVDSAKKGHESGDVDKKKTKKSKKTAVKDVKSGKSKCISLDGEGFDRTKSGGGEPVIIGKTQRLNVHGNEESLSEKLIGKCEHTTCEKLRYNREQLMHLREAAVPADILKAVKEITALLQDENQNPTIQEGTDAHVSNKGQLCTSMVDKEAGEMVSEVKEKKKRGTSSEARKEKKKQKRRKKRAEINRKLGVKRLKLRPILKPKVVSHCRHYLKGRCHEGENCKFSHDVIPLTKSKPCGHFARHSCMKGKDCPYDHELSKYPCNNVVENGFCGRGESCLFSHKISAKEGDSKNETCSLEKSKKPAQQLSVANVPSSGITTTPKSLKENLAVQISNNKPTKAPKGLSFLSFGKPSLDDNKSQPNIDFGGTTNGQPNPGNTLISVPVSPTRERTSVDNTSQPNQTVPPSQRAVDRNRLFVSGPPSPTPRVDSFLPLEIDSSSRKTWMGPPTPQGVSFVTPRKVSDNAKLSPSPSGSDILHMCSQIEDKSIDHKLKGVNLKPQLKSTPGAGQRALLSTLAFAAKFDSGIKISEVNKNDSGSKHKGSAIFELLYGGSKEKG